MAIYLYTNIVPVAHCAVFMTYKLLSHKVSQLTRIPLKIATNIVICKRLIEYVK